MNTVERLSCDIARHELQLIMLDEKRVQLESAGNSDMADSIGAIALEYQDNLTWLYQELETAERNDDHGNHN